MVSESSQGCDCEPFRYQAWHQFPGGEFEETISAEAITKNTPKYFAEADVVIIHARGDEVRRCDTCKKAFDEKFHIPPIWWTTLSRRSNGYFGYENVLDESGTIRTGTISWLRFLMKHVNSANSGHHNKNDINYKWVKLNAFVRWYASSDECPKGRTEIVLFDHPEFAQEVGDFIISQLKLRELSDPFWAYPAMVEKVAALHDVCVWESRTLIRNYEKQRTLYRDPFDYLHEVSRHSLHINETLHVAESILDSMQKYHDHFTATEPSNKENVDRFDPFPQNIKNRLGLLQTTLTHLRHRAESNHERVKAEISLSFNKSAQIESGATRTISLAGLLFLPAAYITALFSTSFFNYDAPTGIWGFSHRFWIYWAVTIPVTVLTIFLWFFGAMIWGAVLNCCKDIRALFQGSVTLGVRETIDTGHLESMGETWAGEVMKRVEKKREEERKEKREEKEERERTRREVKEMRERKRREDEERRERVRVRKEEEEKERRMNEVTKRSREQMRVSPA
ncbi:hypothetical protein TRIATDRAFT_136513 [Trichoderma atroviride IMI 206040]|uniref:Uncharacterized protein n=1 Tax=Hypocrea atroviridis (strain ATCC 20476 / IMI 206040) TaxID=452589 RepID=G9P1X2_HYPAI|nr:uncharacterized protein TRIATDRAFT_136513 [Trichoderma atroviride IMI 206040]EHK43399.1 hypothetical protein TRIATDRAFT_136513 [Trichoderma atroviride IMI 206040]